VSRQPLTPDFFNRETPVVARYLIGATLCRQRGNDVLRWPVTETEAYDGPEDKACHAHVGRTKRTSVLFGEPGVCYVYLCYGVHWMLNVVAGPKDYPAAILIRGAGEVSGPGRLTKALGIDGGLNTKMAVPETGLWFEPGEPLSDSAIMRTPRIGIGYAPEPWLSAPYRFLRAKNERRK